MANGTGPQVEVPGSELNSTVIPVSYFPGTLYFLQTNILCFLF